MTVLVYGLAVAGASTVRALRRRDVEVVVIDDDVSADRVELARVLDVELLGPQAPGALDRLVRSAEYVSPSPGIPETHAVIESARRQGVALLSEIELAYRWEQERVGGPRPMLAITGTDGKTSTTLLTVAMLRAGGLRTVDAGNTDTPLVDAIELDLDAFVVECTSFRLAWTPTFRAEGAVWLNLAPDHLNWHNSMATYEAAKAQVFANQRANDVAIGFISDPTVMANLSGAPGRQVTFGLEVGDYRRSLGDAGAASLVGPLGNIAGVATMKRSLPHDITNALAASALVLETGLGDTDSIQAALSSFTGPPHRLEHVAEIDSVNWFNDSKATTPHAASAAIRSFDRIVLIAGGYDKGVDLSPMAAGADHVSTLIALGDTGPRLAEVFESSAQADAHVHVVADLSAAVELAAEIAVAGDTVLLSPGCASFDQYLNFEARGDHFRVLVGALSTATARDHDVHQQPGDRS